MDTLEDLFRRLEQLNEVGAALSQERDINRLLENILIAAKTITHADGGTLYRVTEDEQSLRFEIVRTDSLQIAFGGASGQPLSTKFRDLPLYQERLRQLAARQPATHGALSACLPASVK